MAALSCAFRAPVARRDCPGMPTGTSVRCPTGGSACGSGVGLLGPRRRPQPLVYANSVPRRERIDGSAPSPSGAPRACPSSAPESTSKAPAEGGAGVRFHVREVTSAEYWNVAAVHTGSFYPGARHPMLFMLQLDRVLALHLGKVIEQNRQVRAHPHPHTLPCFSTSYAARRCACSCPLIYLWANIFSPSFLANYTQQVYSNYTAIHVVIFHICSSGDAHDTLLPDLLPVRIASLHTHRGDAA